jgi:hypothetical protein
MDITAIQQWKKRALSKMKDAIKNDRSPPLEGFVFPKNQREPIRSFPRDI